MKTRRVKVSSSVLKDENGESAKWTIEVALPETLKEAVDCYGEAVLVALANELFATKEANTSRQAKVAEATGGTTVNRKAMVTLIEMLPESARPAVLQAIAANDPAALAVALQTVSAKAIVAIGETAIIAEGITAPTT